MTDLQTASYLLINGFHWYLYGRLLTLFLGQRRVGCPAEAAGYLCAYVLNSLCFLLVGVPLLNLASSLLPLLLLSLLYRAPHWQRLWSALVIYAASFLLDTLVCLPIPPSLETWYPPCSCFLWPWCWKSVVPLPKKSFSRTAPSTGSPYF